MHQKCEVMMCEELWISFPAGESASGADVHIAYNWCKGVYVVGAAQCRCVSLVGAVVQVLLYRCVSLVHVVQVCIIGARSGTGAYDWCVRRQDQTGMDKHQSMLSTDSQLRCWWNIDVYTSEDFKNFVQ